METAEILALDNKTQAAIMNGMPSRNETYPLTVTYPAARGKTVDVTWSSWNEWWAARRIIIAHPAKTGSGKPRNAHPKQKAYVSMLKRNGWL